MLWEALIVAGVALTGIGAGGPANGAGGSATSAGGPAADVVRRFVGLVNEHDVDAALAMLAEDFEFRDPDGTFVIRRDAARAILDWDVAVRARAEVEVLGEGPESVTVELTESNEFLDALGLGTISHRVRYGTRDGSIRRIVLLEAARVGRRTSEALDPVLEWARRERPEELAPLLHDGSPVYSGESAPGWLALLEAARAAGVIEG